MNTVDQERQELRDILLSGNFDFETLTFRVFNFQFHHNALYRSFCQLLNRTPDHISRAQEIPFLPVRFFKTHSLKTEEWEAQLVFRSSGTTKTHRSQHLVRDAELYQEISTSIFEQSYGPLSDYTILALLPSYLEQGDSSLVYMVQTFMDRTTNQDSRFYRFDYDLFRKEFIRTLKNEKKILLWGVTYALLDLAENYTWKDVAAEAVRDQRLIVMETGGMKGRRPEMLRDEVHDILSEAFGVQAVHSEYGMTELLSQCYSKGAGIFGPSSSMRVLAFDVQDPLSYVGDGTTGRCHVIDLANLDSCSFIATDDLCRTRGGTFEIIGRMDHSEIRGCNLLYQEE